MHYGHSTAHRNQSSTAWMTWIQWTLTSILYTWKCSSKNRTGGLTSWRGWGMRQGLCSCQHQELILGIQDSDWRRQRQPHSEIKIHPQEPTETAEIEDHHTLCLSVLHLINRTCTQCKSWVFLAHGTPTCHEVTHHKFSMQISNLQNIKAWASPPRNFVDQQTSCLEIQN